MARSHQTDESIDWQILNEIDQVDPSDPPASHEIYQSFRTHGQMRFERLRKAYDLSDWSVMDREAHALKSSSSCIGATQIQSMCEELRHHIRDSKSDEIKKQLSKINLEIAKVIQILDEHFESLKLKRGR